MRKLLILILLCPLFAMGQVPAIQDTIPVAGTVSFTPQFRGKTTAFGRQYYIYDPITKKYDMLILSKYFRAYGGGGGSLDSTKFWLTHGTNTLTSNTDIKIGTNYLQLGDTIRTYLGLGTSSGASIGGGDDTNGYGSINLNQEMSRLLYFGLTSYGERSLTLRDTGVVVSDSYGRGVQGDRYFAAGYTPNSYVQKRYVDSLAGGGSYWNTTGTTNLGSSVNINTGTSLNIGNASGNLIAIYSASGGFNNFSQFNGGAALFGTQDLGTAKVSGLRTDGTNGVVVVDQLFNNGIKNNASTNYNPGSEYLVSARQLDSVKATISGGGTTTNSLTPGYALTGSSFNGSVARTFAVDTTLAKTKNSALTDYNILITAINGKQASGTYLTPTSTNVVTNKDFSTGNIFPTFNQNTTGSAATVTSIGNLTGDVTSVNRATTLATVNSNVGSFGSATQVPTVTVNAKGLVTAVVNTPIQTTSFNTSQFSGDGSTTPYTIIYDSTPTSGSAYGVTSGGVFTGLAGKQNNVFTTTGDLPYSSSGTTASRLGIGSSGQVLTVTGGVPVWATPSGGSSAANPTGTIGTTAVNGVATTFMRSDAAPAFSTSISRNWTGTLNTFGAATTPTGIPSDTKLLVYDDGGVNGFSSLTMVAKATSNYTGSSLSYGYVNGSNAFNKTYDFGAEVQDITNTASRDFYIYDVISAKYKMAVNPTSIAFGDIADNTSVSADATLMINGNNVNLNKLTASTSLALDGSKNIVSVTNTGTGNNVLATSPTLSGTPVAPTATAGTNTTQIATTAFVQTTTPKLIRLTGSGTGAATTISIAHGQSGITSSSIAIVSPINAASSGISYITTDATNINIIYTVAPASGTNNLSYNVSIKP